MKCRISHMQVDRKCHNDLFMLHLFLKSTNCHGDKCFQANRIWMVLGTMGTGFGLSVGVDFPNTEPVRYSMASMG